MRVGDLRPLYDAIWSARSPAQLVSTLAAAMSLGLGQGVGQAVLYDADPANGKLRILQSAHAGVSPRVARVFERTLEMLSPKLVRAALRTEVQVMSNNPLMATPIGDPVKEYLALAHATDLMTINGWDARGRGVLMSVPLPRPTRVTPEQSRALTRAAAHAVSSTRLLDKEPEPLAVLSSEGVVLEVDERRTRGAPMNDVMAAARRLALVRSRTMAEADRGLARVFPRLDGRWSVVGRFVQGGADHVVLHENPAPALQERTLSLREAQVFGLLQSGHHMKLIAYELGISYATVRVLAARARAKLNAIAAP